MQIGRTRFVHLPRRVTPAARVPATRENPHRTAAFPGHEPARDTARPQTQPHGARVLWRVVPDWHSTSGDPLVAMSRSAKAYGSAQRLMHRPLTGRIADDKA